MFRNCRPLFIDVWMPAVAVSRGGIPCAVALERSSMVRPPVPAATDDR